MLCVLDGDSGLPLHYRLPRPNTVRGYDNNSFALARQIGGGVSVDIDDEAWS